MLVSVACVQTRAMMEVLQPNTPSVLPCTSHRGLLLRGTRDTYPTLSVEEICREQGTASSSIHGSSDSSSACRTHPEWDIGKRSCQPTVCVLCHQPPIWAPIFGKFLPLHVKKTAGAHQQDTSSPKQAKTASSSIMRGAAGLMQSLTIKVFK